MIRLPAFDYYAPSTIEEVVALKAKHGSEAMYVAGGTDLFPNMKRRQFEPKVLIGLRGVRELREITNGAGLTIGAGVTLTDLANHPVVRQDYASLAHAAGLVSSPPLRNTGTIGGNLCLDTRCTYYNQSHAWRKALGFCMKLDGDTCWVALGSQKCLAVSSSDCAPVVVALGAEVQLIGPQGERTIPAEALYRNDGMKYLEKAQDELLVSIHLPPREGWRTSYWKLRRRGSIDFPVLGVAVALRMEQDGFCAEVRLVLGAVSSRPILVTEAADLLTGKRITPQLVREVAEEAAKSAKPLDNTDMALSYRKKMAYVYVARALSEAAGLAEKV
jgi:4-hydroxybenzoyl-CoA reductase subunit beta